MSKPHSNQSIDDKKPMKISAKWNRILQLWENVKIEESNLEKKTKESRNFVEAIHSQLKELEVKYNQCIKESIEKSLPFITYKSLSHSNVNTLERWIAYLETTLKNSLFNQGEEEIDVNLLTKKRMHQIYQRFIDHCDNPDDGRLTFKKGAAFQKQLNKKIKELLDEIEDNLDDRPIYNKKQCLALLNDPYRTRLVGLHPFFDFDENSVSEADSDGMYTFTEEDFAQQLKVEFENLLIRQEDYQHFVVGGDVFDGYHPVYKINQMTLELNDILSQLDEQEMDNIHMQLSQILTSDHIAYSNQQQTYADLLKNTSNELDEQNLTAFIDFAIEHLANSNPKLNEHSFDLIAKYLEKKLKLLKRKIDLGIDDLSDMDNQLWELYYAEDSDIVIENIQSRLEELRKNILFLQSNLLDSNLTTKSMRHFIKFLAETEIDRMDELYDDFW